MTLKSSSIAPLIPSMAPVVTEKDQITVVIKPSEPRIAFSSTEEAYKIGELLTFLAKGHWEAKNTCKAYIIFSYYLLKGGLSHETLLFIPDGPMYFIVFLLRVVKANGKQKIFLKVDFWDSIQLLLPTINFPRDTYTHAHITLRLTQGHTHTCTASILRNSSLDTFLPFGDFTMKKSHGRMG